MQINHRIEIDQLTWKKGERSCYFPQCNIPPFILSSYRKMPQERVVIVLLTSLRRWKAGPDCLYAQIFCFFCIKCCFVEISLAIFTKIGASGRMASGKGDATNG